MKKQLLSALLISSLFLNGCEENKQDNSVPDFMPAQKYKGQGFGEDGDKELKELIKKHKNGYERRGEQFYKDNFHLNVKATNVIADHDVITVFVHCDDRDIRFNASINLDKHAYKKHSSMRSYDDGDAMSNAVTPVISGFEYRAQKEKYDNLYHYFNKKKTKYHYTGYTKEAILKSQDSGYQNSYFTIPGYPMTLSEYRKYYEPLLNLDDKNYKQQFKLARKAVNTESKEEIGTTLFSKRKNYTHKKIHSTMYKIADELESQRKDLPNNIELDLEFNDNKINTRKPVWDEMNPSSYGVFYDNN